MPSTKPNVVPISSERFNTHFTARIYRAHRPAAPVLVYTRCTSANPQDDCTPFVETVIGHQALQPHIHDVSVYVIYRACNGRFVTSRFRVFYKRHTRLPYNWRLNLKGDIVVMRTSAKNPFSVVNLRPSDHKVADFIIES
ncbi:hypothetical protein B0H13DRAFT_2340563 [Mycena leptocephala]|nr:hypothetical protein B0H13DRAFT_2340563 [Mycena leptocephala]